MRLCVPNMMAATVQGIDLETLRARGIEALLLDLDNTLVPWRSRQPRDEVLAWVQRVRDAGFRLCIVSNAGRAGRVEAVARQMGIPFLVRAVKPRRRALRQAAALLGVDPARTAVVGDQLFTDVLGGNRAGMFTVLVAPINSGHEFLSTRVMRRLERLLWRRIEAARGDTGNGVPPPTLGGQP
ncbi:MAG: YqeG family HAD IIIA-type phosphatase [Armatimonadota bacterium]|nr:YqeG family HAD IIIA-type phosphatase [Armatimonadota bacterium]